MVFFTHRYLMTQRGYHSLDKFKLLFVNKTVSTHHLNQWSRWLAETIQILRRMDNVILYFRIIAITGNWPNSINPRMHLFHIPQCSILNRNVHSSVLNGALWAMEHVHSGICEFGLFLPVNRLFALPDLCTSIDISHIRTRRGHAVPDYFRLVLLIEFVWLMRTSCAFIIFKLVIYHTTLPA